MAMKDILFVKANVMNISAKFQLRATYRFWDDFWIFFYKFCLLVAMVINQIKSLLIKKGMFGRGPLKEHFCKSFVNK